MTGDIPCDRFLMIIGAMKCGTSSLYDYLSGHPQLCPAQVKEPEYFSSHQRHGVDVDHYEQLWDFDGRIHRYAVEASTGYTKFPEERGVPQRIRNYGLHPRFVYIVRNPLDRIVSHYNYMQRDTEFTAGIIDDHLINTSNYFLQLNQYQRLFPAWDFLVLDFDQLIADPRAVVTEVCRFLGLDDSYQPFTFGIANQTRVQSTLERWVKRSSLGRWCQELPPPVRYSGQRVLSVLSPRRPRKLTPAEKDYVVERLTPDMQRFQQTYGFDITRWGFQSGPVDDAARHISGYGRPGVRS